MFPVVTSYLVAQGRTEGGNLLLIAACSWQGRNCDRWCPSPKMGRVSSNPFSRIRARDGSEADVYLAEERIWQTV